MNLLQNLEHLLNQVNGALRRKILLDGIEVLVNFKAQLWHNKVGSDPFVRILRRANLGTSFQMSEHAIGQDLRNSHHGVVQGAEISILLRHLHLLSVVGLHGSDLLTHYLKFLRTFNH